MKKDNELRQIISKNLTLCREEKGMSQTELGKVFNKAKTTVASWEQGISLPDAALLYRIAQYYNKPIDYFFERRE